ncbi:hypothetical protein KA005_32175, partial [bacterium]|nr:hypothetical protein [bacterium]
GDIPYDIPGSATDKDHRPLMEPWENYFGPLPPPTLVEITSLSDQWNLVSPHGYSIDKADLYVEYLGTDYIWADAVSGGIVADAFFGWDRTTQGYVLYDTLVPGYGYWLWAYYDCTLKVAV